jgi:hypothetical protein
MLPSPSQDRAYLFGLWSLHKTGGRMQQHGTKVKTWGRA